MLLHKSKLSGGDEHTNCGASAPNVRERGVRLECLGHVLSSLCANFIVTETASMADTPPLTIVSYIVACRPEDNSLDAKAASCLSGALKANTALEGLKCAP